MQSVESNTRYGLAKRPDRSRLRGHARHLPPFPSNRTEGGLSSVRCAMRRSETSWSRHRRCISAASRCFLVATLYAGHLENTLRQPAAACMKAKRGAQASQQFRGTERR